MCYSISSVHSVKCCIKKPTSHCSVTYFTRDTGGCEIFNGEFLNEEHAYYGRPQVGAILYSTPRYVFIELKGNIVDFTLLCEV